MGLVSTLTDMHEEGDLDRRDALLGELRTFAAANPEDPEVQRYLNQADDQVNQNQ